MNKLLILGLALVGTLALAGTTLAAATADQVQPASTITYNEKLQVNGDLEATGTVSFPKGVHIGGANGGVTYFNGTIVNNNTNTPVTIGDNLRVDGVIYRTEVGGSHPVKISDSVIPTLNNANDFGSASNKWKNGYFAGTLAVGSISGTGVVNSVNIKDGTITGDDINSSSDLEIDSLSLTGDVEQETTKHGIAKAMALVGPDGSGGCAVISSWGPANITCSNLFGGQWDVDFNFSVENRYYAVTSAVEYKYTAAEPLTGSNADVLRVWTCNDDGTYSTSRAMVIIY